MKCILVTFMIIHFIKKKPSGGYQASITCKEVTLLQGVMMKTKPYCLEVKMFFLSTQNLQDSGQS